MLFATQHILQRTDQKLAHLQYFRRLKLIHQGYCFFLVKKQPQRIGTVYILLHLIFVGAHQEGKETWVQQESIEDEFFHELK